MTAEFRGRSDSEFSDIRGQASQCFEHAAKAITSNAATSEKTLAGALRRMSLQTETIRSPLALADHCECSTQKLLGMQNQVKERHGQRGLAEASHRLKHVAGEAMSYVGRVALWSLADTTPLTPSLRQCVVEWGGDPAEFQQLSRAGELGLRGLPDAVWNGNWRKNRVRRIAPSIGYQSDAGDIQTLFRSFASPEEEVAWLGGYGGTLVATWSLVWDLMAPEPTPGYADFNAPSCASFIVPRFDDRVLVAHFSEFIQFAEL